MIVYDVISHEGYLPKCRPYTVLFFVSTLTGCNASRCLQSDVATNSRLHTQVECRSCRKKPCFWLMRKKVGYQAPFHVKNRGPAWWHRRPRLRHITASRRTTSGPGRSSRADMIPLRFPWRCCRQRRRLRAPRACSTLGHSMFQGVPCASAVEDGELGGGGAGSFFSFLFFLHRSQRHRVAHRVVVLQSHLQRCVKDHVQPGIVKKSQAPRDA